jgi:Cu/Ag efflux pump CusA
VRREAVLHGLTCIVLTVGLIIAISRVSITGMISVVGVSVLEALLLVSLYRSRRTGRADTDDEPVTTEP